MADDSDDKVVSLKPKRGRGNPNNKGKGASVHGSKGDGWGGPAWQGRRGHDPSALIPGQSAEKRARSADKVEERELRTQELEEFFYDGALRGTMQGSEQPLRPETRATMAKALHEIYNGKPVQTQKVDLRTELSNLTDEQLDEKLAAVAAQIGHGPAPNVH